MDADADDDDDDGLSLCEDPTTLLTAAWWWWCLAELHRHSFLSLETSAAVTAVAATAHALHFQLIPTYFLLQHKHTENSEKLRVR